MIFAVRCFRARIGGNRYTIRTVNRLLKAAYLCVCVYVSIVTMHEILVCQNYMLQVSRARMLKNSIHM